VVLYPYVGRSLVHGHPQCLRKVTTTGFPSTSGIASLEEAGAFWSTPGTSFVGRLEGNIHDLTSVCHGMLIDWRTASS
jgi:hypothetical protein